MIVHTFGSLFAGIGGFDLGFEKAGMQCKWQVEIDSYCQKVLKKHWPKVHREKDIRDCGRHNLEWVDVIAGGFPCQDISYAGRGAGLDGERSGLFFEAIRVVRELQPRFVVLENVAALLTRGLDRVLGTLAEVGYDAEWHCIPAAAVGAPHIRDRVFVIATLANADCERCSKARCSEGGCGISGCGSSLADSRCQLRQSRVISESSVEEASHGIEEANNLERCCKNVSNTDSARLEEWQGKNTNRSRTICGSKPSRSEWWDSEPDVGRVANGVSSRVDRLRSIGNAVVPQVAEFIGRHVLQALEVYE